MYSNKPEQQNRNSFMTTRGRKNKNPMGLFLVLKIHKRSNI